MAVKVLRVEEVLDDESDGAATQLHAAREVGARDRLMAADEGERDLAIDAPRGAAGGDVKAGGVDAAHLPHIRANSTCQPLPSGSTPPGAAHGAAAGRSRVEIPLDYDGAAIDIAFDPSYLVDMLKVLSPDDALTLELNDGSKPALFKCGSDYQYLVMPLS